ncbi:MAG: shikimate kinase [Nitriliruptoraceae bacterium]|jgi:shikimate kinase
MSRTIALTGMPGSGKSTVGRLLAARLGRSFADVDAEIEKVLDRPVTQIVDEAGIEYFREVEHQIIRRLLRHNDIVVSLGGGAVLADDNVAELLLTGVLVHLDVPVSVLVDRIVADPAQVAQRPLLAGDPRAALARLHLERDHRYREVAELVLDASGVAADVTEEVLAWARRAGDVLTPSEHEVTM